MLTPRVLAWRILRSGSTTPVRRARRVSETSKLDPRDRAFVRAMIGVEVRRRGTLRALVREFTPRAPNADLAAHLHLGLVQILFLDQIPDHAAVDQSVRAAQATLGARAGHIVNAVLRAVLRCRAEGASGDKRKDLPRARWHLTREVFHDPDAHPLLWAEEALSMPVAWMRRWMKRYGPERAFDLASHALTPPALSVRVTRAGAARARDAIAAELAALGCTPSPGRHQGVLLLPSSDTARVIASALFERGAITVQGETALCAAELMEARVGEHLLDLCAAPGGKTAVLAEAGARVLARDRSESRMERLAETMKRLQLEERVDCAVLPEIDAPEPETFDGVLVDAPCSNTGVFAQRPEARWRFEAKFRESLAGVQALLLERGAAGVRAGGRLVYSTCSIEPEENQRRVRSFLAAHPEFTLEAELEALPREALDAGPIDGGYAARLRKR